MQAAEKIDETMDFEKALSELEAIVRGLESGKAPLEDSIHAYERGIALKQFCEQKLEQARLKVEQITLNKDGKLLKQPFDTNNE